MGGSGGLKSYNLVTKDYEIKKYPLRFPCFLKGWRPRLYTADSRSGSWGSVLPTLMGQPVPLRLHSPRPVCNLIISQNLQLVKHFFQFIFVPVAGGDSLVPVLRQPEQVFLLCEPLGLVGFPIIRIHSVVLLSPRMVKL